MGQGLISVILSLPEKYREVIYLHYYAGYRVEEMARMLGTTANAVKKKAAERQDAHEGKPGRG